MSVRTQALLIVSLSQIALFLVLFVLISGLIYRNFSALETSFAERNLSLVRDTFQAEVENLATKLSDWSAWDDTYKFIQDQNPEYIQSNIQPEALANLKINMIIYLNTQSEIVYYKGYDFPRGEDLPLPPSLSTLLTSKSPLSSHRDLSEFHSGLLNIPETGPAIFSSQPITNTPRTAPSRGTLIFIRLFDSTQINRLSQITHLDIASEPISDHRSNPIEFTTSDLLTAHLVLPDYFDQPSLHLHLRLPRDIQDQAQRASIYLALSLIFSGSVLTFILFIFLERLILSRFLALNRQVLTIASAPQSSSQLSLPRVSDEFSQLTSSINQMLRQIHLLGQDTDTKNRLLSSQITDTETKNQDLLDSQKATLNLLEDARELETQLKLERDQAQAIISSMGDGLYVINSQDYTVTLINPVASQLLGLTPEDAIGQDTKKLIEVYKNGQLLPPAQRPAAITIDTGQAVISNVVDHYELKTQNGKTIPVSLATTPIKSGDKTIAVVVTFRDISTEIKLTTQFQLERDRAQAIISSMGEGLLVIDSLHRITLLNPMAEKLLDTTATLALGQPWTKIVKTFAGDTEIPTHERTAIKSLSTGKTMITTLDANHFYVTPSGRRFPVTSITTPIPKSSGGGVVKVFKDATHEKEEKNIIEAEVQDRTRQLQEKNLALEKAKTMISDGWFQLQREKVKLTASLDSLSFGFILTDPSESLLFINRSAITILNLPETTFRLTDIEKVLSPACDIHALHEKCRAQKVTLEVKDILYGNKFLHLFLTPISLTTDKEEYIGTAILVQDVTEAKVLERSKDEFFSIASHELRTPLTAIRGNISLIKQFYAAKFAEPDLSQMLSDVEESSIRLIGIVNDFLNMSRLEQGRMEYNKAPFDVTTLTRDVISEFSPTASEKSLTLALADSATPPYIVNSDKDRLKEVLINLIGNALKYTDAGGITLALSPFDHQLKIMVSDTGRGIPPAQQSLLFRKFQQAGESLFTRDTTKGTGLGLYISKLIIEGMGGKIWLEKSAPSEGSTFACLLPLA